MEEARLFKIRDPLHETSTAVYTRQDAINRALLVSNVQYDFTLALREGQDYLGSAIINFTLLQKPSSKNIIVLTLKILVSETSFYLNFSVQGIEKIILNGVILQEPVYLNHRVNLNTDECRELLKVENEVIIEYCQRYNTNRVGLHSFTDQRTSVRRK